MFPNNISMNGNGMVIRNGNQIITMGPGGMKIVQGNDIIEMDGSGIRQNGSERPQSNIFSGNSMPGFDQIFGQFDRFFSTPNATTNSTTFSFSTSNQHPRQFYSSPQQEEEESEGLSQAQINQFPVRKFRKLYAKNDDQNQCAICQEEYVEREKVMTLKCFHAFHSQCATDWLKRKAICPMCNTNM